MAKNQQQSFAVNDGTGFVMNFEVVQNILPQNTLFIHGNLASNRWWYPTQEVWQQQSTQKNLIGSMILAEFRGCGQSSAPKEASEVTMSRFADDFISLVKSKNWGPINLVGHSTGGLIAALMLAKAPELFNKAIFLDPVGAEGVKFDNNMLAAFEQMKVDKNLVSIVMNSTIYKNDDQADFFKQVVVEDAFSAVKKVGALVLQALDGLNVTDLVKKIQKPVLVLHGEHDVLLSKDASKQLADLIPSAKFKEVKDHGHCANVENPKNFVQICNDFLFT
jgi:3-oxoadipate enol-lactonase